MNHGDVRKHLADYLEGDLGLEHRALVDAHLDGCEECSREVAEMQQTVRLLRMLPEPETPPMIAANVMRRIRAGETQPSGLRRFLDGLKSVFEPSFVLPASAIAAAALVIVVLQDPASLTLPALMGGGMDVNGGGPAPEFAAADGGSAGNRAAHVAGLETVVPGLTPRALAPRSAERRRPTPVFRRDLAASPSGFAANESATATPGTASRTQATARTRRTVYVDPMLAPPIPRSTVPDVFVANGSGVRPSAPPPTTFVMDRFAESPVLARAIAQTQGLDAARRRPGFASDAHSSFGENGRPGISSGGEDPRDLWLARGLSDPVGFAHFIAGQNLAEQELWVSRLSERAEARGLLGELTDSLRQSGDPTAAWLANDFEAEARAENEATSAEPLAR